MDEDSIYGDGGFGDDFGDGDAMDVEEPEVGARRIQPIALQPLCPEHSTLHHRLINCIL